MSNDSNIGSDYDVLLRALKARIRTAQVRAVLAVNRELVLLYWQLRREILTRQQQQGWGAKVIDKLAKDLQKEFPEMKGFSPRNLKYMRMAGVATSWSIRLKANSISVWEEQSPTSIAPYPNHNRT